MGMTRDPRTIPASTGVAADREFRAVAPPPLYLTSTFAFEGFERNLGHEYTRTSNPARDLLAETPPQARGRRRRSHDVVRDGRARSRSIDTAAT